MFPGTVAHRVAGVQVRSLFNELKRRNVYRAAAFYAAAGWVVVQIATAVFPIYDIPNWVMRLTIAVVVTGFPFAIALSWFYEWTPQGWRRESEVDRADATAAIKAIARLASGEAAAQAAAPIPTDKSIAVLSFADMSELRDQEYFSDGLAEELLNLLAQLPQLRVIARSSSFSFKGRNVDVATIARKLNVATVLEGSVRKSRNRLRVTAQLIRATDSSHLWSQTYDRELTDVFEVQDEIARAVVDALKVKLLPSQHVTNAHRTENTDAYDKYLLGHNVLRRGRYDDFRRALLSFERAVTLDPHYAAAHAALASAQSAVADFAATPAERSAGKLQALATAEHAIAIAPDLADGYVIRAHLRKSQLWDWDGAATDLQRALELEPSEADVLRAYGLLLINLARLDEAIATTRRAIDADPLSWLSWMMLGAILWRAGRIDEGRLAMERALEISPDSSFTRYELGCLELVQGHTDVALAHFRAAGEAFRQAGVAMAEHTLGNERESRAALAELEAKYAAGFSYQVAQAHAWLGDIDAAFAWLDRCYEQHDTGLGRLRGDAMYRQVEHDPRYAVLLRKLNFPA